MAQQLQTTLMHAEHWVRERRRPCSAHQLTCNSQQRRVCWAGLCWARAVAPAAPTWAANGARRPTQWWARVRLGAHQSCRRHARRRQAARRHGEGRASAGGPHTHSRAAPQTPGALGGAGAQRGAQPAVGSWALAPAVGSAAPSAAASCGRWTQLTASSRAASCYTRLRQQHATCIHAPALPARPALPGFAGRQARGAAAQPARGADCQAHLRADQLPGHAGEDCRCSRAGALGPLSVHSSGVPSQRCMWGRQR